MDQRTTDRELTDRGVSSVQFLLAAGMALVLFVALANLVVVQYGRGVVRSALEQGGRAGALTGDPVLCEAVAQDVASQLLGGRMSDDLVVACEVEGELMVASGSGVFESWTPLGPDYSFSIASTTALEPDP